MPSSTFPRMPVPARRSRPRRGGRTRLAAVALAAVLAGVGTVYGGPPPARAASSPFSCLPANGLSTVNDADQLLAGWVVIPGYPKVWIGTGRINWAMDPYGSETWVRLFLSLKWAEKLTQQYVSRGTVAYLDRAQAIAADFAAANPPGGGPRPLAAWSGMYAGQRTTVYSCIDSLRPGVTAIRNALAGHGAWLADPSHDPGNWNQGVDYNLGYLAAGCRLGRSDWTTAAVDRLGVLGTATVDADGAVVEQAPGYGSYLYSRLTLAAAKIAECGRTVPASLVTRPPKLLEFLAWASEPHGPVVQLGDTFADKAYGVKGTPTEYTASGGTAGTPPTGQVKVYPRGYLFARSTWSPYASASYASLRFGPGRNWHGHDDHGGVTLHGLGHPLLVDSGHFGYTAGAYRDFLRSPQAHNVMVMPGVRFDRSVATTITRQSSGPGWVFAEVTDTAFGGMRRTRSVFVDLNLPAVVVLDRAGRATSGAFDQLWHLPPGTSVSIPGRSYARATSGDGKVTTVLAQVPLAGQTLPAGSTTVVSGQTSPYQGWVSYHDRQRLAAPVVTMRRSGTSTATLTAVVAGASSGTVSVSSVRDADGLYRLTLRAGDRSSVVRVSPGGWIGR